MQLQKGQPKIKIQKYIELSTFKSLNAICFSLKKKKQQQLRVTASQNFTEQQVILLLPPGSGESVTDSYSQPISAENSFSTNQPPFVAVSLWAGFAGERQQLLPAAAATSSEETPEEAGEHAAGVEIRGVSSGILYRAKPSKKEKIRISFQIFGRQESAGCLNEAFGFFYRHTDVKRVRKPTITCSSCLTMYFLLAHYKI